MAHFPKLNLMLALLLLTALLPPTAVTAARPIALPATPLPPVNPLAQPLEIRADALGLPLSDHAAARPYAKPAVLLPQGSAIHFEATIDQAGHYTIAFDMTALDTFISAPEGQLWLDGALAAADTQRILFPVFYQNRETQFPLDRYGNEALIRQEQSLLWRKTAVRDANFSQPYPLTFYLSAGEHRFEFRQTQESMLLGSIYLEPFAPYPTYSAYRQAHQGTPDAVGVLLVLEAEYPTYKNDTAIRPINSRNLEVTPYDTHRLLLNTLGGESWERSGSAVYYAFTVPADGLYTITLRALQNGRSNFTVFRRLTINNEVPFAELNAVPFAYATSWQDVTLGGGTPYKIFLRQGVNVLGLEATSAPYETAVRKIQKVLLDINTLALEVKRLTGNQVDPYKEWVISEYIPDIQERLLAIADDLRTDLDVLVAINGSGRSPEILAYQMAIDNILSLAAEPDKLPIRLKRFSEGSGSAAQLLGDLLPSLQSQPLTLDKLFIHAADTPPPPPKVSFLTSLLEALKRFFYSFRPNPYQSTTAQAGELSVWVNRPRQYVDLMQRLADERFTPASGVSVKFSIMPDESKLILANAAGIQPDVALGVSTNIPYELAIRNALYDLRTFPDFDSAIHIYSPGALLSYIINDSVYAIPETQDFWVTFYRQDIMNSLSIPIPQTWREVIEILPELQRYGMNYNTPLSSGSGVKGYLLTAPYLFNHGAELYSADGFATGLGSDEAITAIKFMTESFTIYGMPLTTSSFYDSFRYGSLPIGVSNFETYLKLLTAAPELNGLWEIDLYPATVLPDGAQYRYATGSAQAGLMFASTDQPDEGWEFMKWWMSTATQVDFQQQLILGYGLEYLWNSANVEAFAYSPIPQAHKEVILAQWEWLQEPVKLPGSYMQERELSNAWNRIVFDGVNPRIAIDTAVITINREITRKMEEFGYLQDGVVIKAFNAPTIDTVKAWMEEAHEGD